MFVHDIMASQILTSAQFRRHSWFARLRHACDKFLFLEPFLQCELRLPVFSQVVSSCQCLSIKSTVQVHVPGDWVTSSPFKPVSIFRGLTNGPWCSGELTMAAMVVNLEFGPRLKQQGKKNPLVLGGDWFKVTAGYLSISLMRAELMQSNSFLPSPINPDLFSSNAIHLGFQVPLGNRTMTSSFCTQVWGWSI